LSVGSQFRPATPHYQANLSALPAARDMAGACTYTEQLPPHCRRLGMSLPARPIFVNAACLCAHDLPLFARTVGVNATFTFVLARLFLRSLCLFARTVFVCAACRGLTVSPRLVFVWRIVGVCAPCRCQLGLPMSTRHTCVNATYIFVFARLFLRGLSLPARPVLACAI
jgi:hypothetical protein